MNPELESLKTEIRGLLENLHSIVASALVQSTKAFEDLDCELADEVTNESETVEVIHHSIEDKAFEGISRYQPQDKDLRRLISYIHTAGGLRSIGRYAMKICEIVNLAEGLDHFKELVTLPYLAELSTSALSVSIRSVIDENLDEIDELEKLEAQSDNEASEMFQEIADYLNHRRDISNIAMLYVIVGRYYERASDQAITIAESAVYLVSGKRKKLGLAYKGIDDIRDMTLDI
ncbi:MAG: hypothetical protein JW779_15430 [Candidatus Thorarchaeota archaeon]|nr:hypothetical protein [Candidatus Thorarchaeota archaeon]